MLLGRVINEFVIHISKLCSQKRRSSPNPNLLINSFLLLIGLVEVVQAGVVLLHDELGAHLARGVRGDAHEDQQRGPRKPAERRQARDALHRRRGAVQAEFESKLRNQDITFQFQGLKPGSFKLQASLYGFSVRF